MESESGTTNTKISDSGYSNSCSNTNSQRSASSKSRHSGSNSSRSSGYCGAQTVDGSTDAGPPPPNKRNKDKKKKAKSGSAPNSTTATATVVTTEWNGTANKETTIENVVTMPLTDSEPICENPDDSCKSKDMLDEQAMQNDLLAADSTPPNDIIRAWNGNQQEECGDVAEGENAMEMNAPCEQQEEDDVKVPPQPEDGFWCVISMYDGVVFYTTPNLTSVLGFPKDMWLGRSFIDFVHPKDRETFSSKITSGIALPLVDSTGKSKDVSNTLYVCLRKYRGLKNSGYSVIEKSVNYQAFKLTVTFRNINDSKDGKKFDNNAGMFLVIVAVPVHSSYNVPDETRKSTKFIMRHTSACTFSHVDSDVVSNFGFLPQDMLGKSVFDFYHPEDLPFLKEVYESVMRMCQIAGSVFRSKPYRFAVQNGSFVMIETEWSSFVNPWSRRMEFVIGLHRVLKGPHNPNIFETRKDDETKLISEEVLKESKIIQEEILILLNKELSRPTEAAKHEVSKRCKDLATFMETLMDEVSKSKLQLELPQDHDPTISERDSVMLGEISPHHDYYDSKSSSETPPSYTQLNYNENIQRFFKSKPKTTVSDGSVERPGPLQVATDVEHETLKGSSAAQECANNQKCLSPVQNSGASGSGSAGNLSSGSNPNMESGTTSGTNTSNDSSYKPPHLTEALLFKHNEDMEKMMAKRHRDHRSSSRADRDNKKSHHKAEKNIAEMNVDKNEPMGNHGQGLKRCGSHSWEGENHKVSKHNHKAVQNGVAPVFGSGVRTVNAQKPAVPANDNVYTPEVNSLWPPFSVASTAMNTTQTYGVTSSPNVTGSFAPGMFPIYYIPTYQKPVSREYTDSPIGTGLQVPVQYMPGMMHNYNTIFTTSPIFCPPVPMISLPLPQQMMAPEQIPAEHKPGPANVRVVPQFQRPASQATSVKAEPGSAMSSIASASVANKAMSECSRKDLGLQSVCSPDSPLVSPAGGETDMDNSNLTTKTREKIHHHEDDTKFRVNHSGIECSSNSSFYSSFFKTDTASGSNDEGAITDNQKSDDNHWKARQYPMRKREPPWLDGVSTTPELIYRYQMSLQSLDEILESDLKALKEIQQPALVNEQLSQLYIEMELEGLSTKLTLEEGITSSSSSGDDCVVRERKPKKKRRSYSSLMMIFEENAPLPSPEN